MIIANLEEVRHLLEKGLESARRSPNRELIFSQLAMNTEMAQMFLQQALEDLRDDRTLGEKAADALPHIHAAAARHEREKTGKTSLHAVPEEL
jgi:hypothetical protein